VIKARFGEELDGRIQRLFPFLFRRSIDPNLLTVMGLLVSLAGAVAFARGAFRLAAALVLIGGFFDLVDGVVARHHGTVTTFGAFLDSTLDRVVDMALLLGIQMHYARSGSPGLAWLAGLALVACIMVSYTKARAESVLPGFKGGLMERAERIVVLVAGALFGLMPLALGVVAAGAGVTAVQRIVLARRGMDVLDRERAKAAPAEGA
jgi:CDP-diacylglycerol--glycerol-3-phosphate 3-phosphatidyltransferase